ncbi:MAG: class I SAM-dependent methyltransferase [Solirubrobacterales bacterium]|nr:class I SAM-dependent methyltransferase [Solirubrobacterales bacterium]
MQIRVAGSASVGFVQEGRDAAASIRTLLARAAIDLEQLETVLDFGGGCGRIARHWAALHGPEFYACDIDAAAVAWCRRNLAFVNTAVNQLEPPLPYVSESFDLVYAYSVFTHLPERAQRPWIEELSRVIRPGGFLLVTTHGDATLERIVEPELRARYQRGELAVRFARDAGSNLCSAYHPPAFVRGLLAPAFECMGAQHGGMPGFGIQDAYLARKVIRPS